MLDTTMDQGLAVPMYKKLTEVALSDSDKNKNILIRAYNYLATYEPNISKNYTASVGYYEKYYGLIQKTKLQKKICKP